MRRLSLALVVLSLAAALAGCSDRVSLRDRVAAPLNEFRCNESPDTGLFEIFSGGPTEASNYDVTCSLIELPESRTGRSDRTIEVAVAVYHSRAETPLPDPIVYLAGGPGGSGIEEAWWVMDSAMDDLLNKRDIVFIDQRGTGESRPALMCDDGDIDFDAGDHLPDSPEARAIYQDAVEDCRDRLASRGIDLGSYTTDENAADISEVLTTLGYSEWNLYGVSYGTRLALAMMRDDPAPIRSVVLDSTVPLDARYTGDTTASFVRAMNVMFAACEADSACAADYPDLRTKLLETFKALDAEPYETKSPLALFGVGGESILFDAERLYDLLFILFYDAAAVAELPAHITALSEGDYGFIDVYSVLASTSFGGIAMGMHLSVICSEDVPFADFGQPRGADELEEYIYRIDDDGVEYTTQCDAWDVAELASDSLGALTSDIPTLILAGSLDPITPPAYGEQAAKSLANSYFFEFANASHGLLGGACPDALVTSFIAEPGNKPGDPCLDNALDAVEFHEPLDMTSYLGLLEGLDTELMEELDIEGMMDNVLEALGCTADTLEECLAEMTEEP